MKPETKEWGWRWGQLGGGGKSGLREGMRRKTARIKDQLWGCVKTLGSRKNNKLILCICPGFQQDVHAHTSYNQRTQRANIPWKCSGSHYIDT